MREKQSALAGFVGVARLGYRRAALNLAYLHALSAVAMINLVWFIIHPLFEYRAANLYNSFTLNFSNPYPR